MNDPSLPGAQPGSVTFPPDQAGPGTAQQAPGAAPGAAPEAPETAVTGRRAVAALIDIAVLLGLLVILSQIVGRTSPEMGGGIRSSIRLLTITRPGHTPVGIGLYGAWTLLYAAITLAYYFALEAWTGQTVGKGLLGLRVSRAGGGRAGPGAIAGRTLLRIIDGLPLLYLVGFVSVLATGKRRARIGDLAAGTAVMRSRPARHRFLAAAALIAVAAGAAGLLSYRLASSGRPQAYSGHGVSFSYPAGWQQVPATELRAVTGGTRDFWRAGLALDRNNLIVAEAFPQDPPVTAANLAAVTPQLGHELRQLVGRAHGTVLAGLERATLGGLPAGQAWISMRNRNGVPVQDLEIFAFRGATTYHLECQHTPARAAQVARACAQVMRTFTVAGLPSGQEPGPVARPSPFETGAAAVCDRASGQWPAAPPRNPSAAEIAATADRLARFIDHTLAGFAGVTAPPAWQYRFGVFLAHAGQLRDAMANIASSIRADDPGGAASQWHAALAAAARLRHDNGWLTGHGLAACTGLDGLTR